MCSLPSQTIVIAQKAVAEFKEVISNSHHSYHHVEPPIRVWRPPMDDEVKINVDASFQQSMSEAVADIIVRNSEGPMMGGVAPYFLCGSL